MGKNASKELYYATFFLRLCARASNPASISTFDLPRCMKRLLIMAIIFDVAKDRFYITRPLFAMIDVLLTVQVLFYLLLIFFLAHDSPR